MEDSAKTSGGSAPRLLGAALDALRVPLHPGTDDPARGVWWGRHWREAAWQLQFARLLVDPVFRGHGIPRGDGRAVVLIPGFLAGDFTLAVLAGWLARIGYEPHGSGMQANVDCFDRALDRLEARVGALHERTGRRVALIGHSRGGHFAKALAQRRPDWVSHVVSMGAGLDEPLAVSAPIKALVHAFSALHRSNDPDLPRGCMTGECDCRAFRDYRAPFPPQVPITSIYTTGDGCLRCSCCVVPYADVVEVGGGHVGLAFDRRAYAAVAHALAAPERAAAPARDEAAA
jgi:pimeloyl-ACP methyl ester carboxylesterase